MTDQLVSRETAVRVLAGGDGVPTSGEKRAAQTIVALYDRLDDLYKPMPHCGHEQRFVATSDEGTSFCSACVYEGRIAELEAKLKAASERCDMLLEAKNYWMARCSLQERMPKKP